jgi:hypothetical protein
MAREMSSPDWFWHRIEQRMHPDLKRRPYDCGFERLVDLWAEAIEEECKKKHVSIRTSTAKVMDGKSSYWGLSHPADKRQLKAKF